ncbi:hypothetical protein HYPSUDRAFT_115767, partial [Hypholoma sublateritium FD-334 SS-4]
STRPYKRARTTAGPHRSAAKSTGGSYHDRIPLEDDYEVLKARTVSSGPNNMPIETATSILPLTWTFGNSWAPDDDLEYSLDPDDGWYDEVLEADVGDVMEKVMMAKGKKKRSEASVCAFFVMPALFSAVERLDPMCIGSIILGICTSTRFSDTRAAAISSTTSNALTHWDGASFSKTTLREVGLVVHLNHASMKCPTPAACDERLLIIHTTGVHEVMLGYCACYREIPRDLQLLRRGLYPASRHKIRTCVTFPLLRLFHLLSLMGKVSTYDMYRSIERLTNNTGIRMPRSRYRPTMRCFTQWRHLKALKRGGRGHDASGADGTSNGELAIMCPSCPHPGINLPDDWAREPKERQFLYALLICMDANFRLKNHLVSNFSVDPGLWNGMAYMVPRAPYEEYVLSQADAEDISTCVGFQALAKATTQNTRGLRYTGVSGAMCGRSEMVLPNSVGNLQRGERYANMDYTFASAIKSTQLMLVAISYDIACQWFINIFSRMLQWPKELRPRAGLNLRPLIPKFHEPAHLEKGHEQYSFNLAEGVGLSDGECPERVWGSHNPLAGSTRTMGPGTREDVLDDNFGHWNWLKYSSMGTNLQVEAHRGFSSTLPLDLVRSWELLCATWDVDGFPKAAPNPFKTAEAGISEADLEAQLSREEAASAKQAKRVSLHSTSATSFLAMGLELEEAQRAVRLVYMPGVLQIQTDCGLNPTALWNSNPNPEDVELWLPSAIPSNRRRAACAEGLPEMELKFRTAQCENSLDGLRRTLRVKTRMVYFKNKNIRGQREGTRSRAIIDRVHSRAIRYVQKYRAARRAKLRLEGPGAWEGVYQELRNEDVRGFASGIKKAKRLRKGIWEDGHAPHEEEPAGILEEETESDPDLNDSTEGGPVRSKRKRKKGTGETRKELSWIWRTLPLSDGNENDDILRAEWARSRARVRRATEEVLLVLEEMRRVLEFLKWKAKQWDLRRVGRVNVGAELREGIYGYAVEQAKLQRLLSASFKILWKTPLDEVEGLIDEEAIEPPANQLDNEDGEDDED